MCVGSLRLRGDIDVRVQQLYYNNITSEMHSIMGASVNESLNMFMVYV